MRERERRGREIYERGRIYRDCAGSHERETKTGREQNV